MKNLLPVIAHGPENLFPTLLATFQNITYGVFFVNMASTYSGGTVGASALILSLPKKLLIL